MINIKIVKPHKSTTSNIRKMSRAEPMILDKVRFDQHRPEQVQSRCKKLKSRGCSSYEAIGNSPRAGPAYLTLQGGGASKAPRGLLHDNFSCPVLGLRRLVFRTEHAH